MSQAITLRIDPFFDDEEAGFSPGSEPGIKAFAKVYKDPNTERMGNGASIVQLAGAGPRGIAGVLIPHATQGGVPEGISPNDISDIEINIDPQLPGQSAQIRLGDLHAALTTQSMEEARALVPDGGTSPRRRRRASAAYRLAAEHIAAGDVAPPEDREYEQPARRTVTHRHSQAPIQQPNIRETSGTPVRSLGALPSFSGTATAVASPAPAAFGPPPMQPQQRQPARRPGSMMGAFSPPAQQQAPEPEQPTYAPAPAVRGPAAPTRRVIFEIQQFGEITAFYHDINYDQNTGKIMLVYDTNYVGGTKWFPPLPVENAPPMAMMEENGQNVVCLVTHSGMQYLYEGKEFCILDCHEVGQLPG